MLGPQHPVPSEGTGEVIDKLHALWRELADFSVSRSTDAMRSLLEWLCERTGAQDASWVAVKCQESLPRRLASEGALKVVEEMNGWVPMAALYLNERKSFQTVMERWLMHASVEGVDPLSVALVDGNGNTRVRTMRDVATEEVWSEHWFSRKYLSFYGVGDRMMGAFPINESCESCIVLDRSTVSGGFDMSHRNLLHQAIAGVPDLHRFMFLERGILNSTMLLSRREMDTYRMLLTEMSESEIAEKMQLSTHTVHDYARQLYKKFKVKGRVGLMALVLGGLI